MDHPTNRELIDNLYQWVYNILNRLDQIENPGMEPRWLESEPWQNQGETVVDVESVSEWESEGGSAFEEGIVRSERRAFLPIGERG